MTTLHAPPRTRRRPSAGAPAKAAACANPFIDPDIFFTEHDYPTALAICGGCPVRAACRQFALDTAPEFGVFGGLTPIERRVLRRELAA